MSSYEDKFLSWYREQMGPATGPGKDDYENEERAKKEEMAKKEEVEPPGTKKIYILRIAGVGKR
jgi:hypothetical protein